MKFFDRMQLIITIAFGACLLLAFISFVIMLVTATPMYNDDNILSGLKYHIVPQTLFTIFTFSHIALFFWFVARTITYKMRKKEWEQEHAGY